MSICSVIIHVASVLDLGRTLSSVCSDLPQQRTASVTFDPVPEAERHSFLPTPAYGVSAASLHLIKSEVQKNSRRLELSISRNTPHGRWGECPGTMDPRFPAGLPFPVPEILEFVAFCDSGKNLPAIFPGLSRSFLRERPNRPRKQPQPPRVL